MVKQRFIATLRVAMLLCDVNTVENSFLDVKTFQLVRVIGLEV